MHLGVPEPAGPGRGVEHRPLGPDVYDGSAGVALFLAEVAARDGDLPCRATALARPGTRCDGPIWRAVAACTTDPPASPRRSPGRAAGDDAVVARALSLAADALRGEPAAEGFDLMTGHAGSLVATLLLGAVARDPALIEVATAIGDRLVEGARDRGGAWSWPAPPSHGIARDLTGLAYGAAGIGWALLELDAVAPDERYRDAARRAFAFERGLFDAEAGNWPDLREDPGRAFMCTWCHGAAGIAATRARAYALLGDEELRGEAEVGLATTAWMTRAMLRGEGTNYSLCHGLAGNAQILSDAVELSGGRIASDPQLALEVAHEGVARHLRSADGWPCGTHAGEAPGLMLGTAGIGMFLLRVSGCAIPSVLLPSPATSLTRPPSHDLGGAMTEPGPSAPESPHADGEPPGEEGYLDAALPPQPIQIVAALARGAIIDPERPDDLPDPAFWADLVRGHEGISIRSPFSTWLTRAELQRLHTRARRNCPHVPLRNLLTYLQVLIPREAAAVGAVNPERVLALIRAEPARRLRLHRRASGGPSPDHGPDVRAAGVPGPRDCGRDRRTPRVAAPGGQGQGGRHR